MRRKLRWLIWWLISASLVLCHPCSFRSFHNDRGPNGLDGAGIDACFSNDRRRDFVWINVTAYAPAE
jgi:hypothetical protein